MQRCFGQGLQYVAICCLFCPYFLIFSNRTVNWHKYGQTTTIYRVLLGKNQWVFHIYSQYLRCLQGIYPMDSYQNPDFFLHRFNFKSCAIDLSSNIGICMSPALHTPCRPRLLLPLLWATSRLFLGRVIRVISWVGASAVWHSTCLENIPWVWSLCSFENGHL